MINGKWVGKEGVAVFRSLETYLQNLLLLGRSTQSLVLSCFLLVNFRTGVSDWATGDLRPQQHWLILRCPRLGVQSEVSDFL